MWAVAVVVAVLLWPQPLIGGEAIPHEDGPATETPHDIADALLLLSLALRSGQGMLDVLDDVGSRIGGVTGARLRSVAAAQRWGHSVAESWSRLPEPWRPAAMAWQAAAESGAAPADLIARAAGQIRRSEDLRIEVTTTRAGVRLVLPLGLCFLPAFIATTVVPVVVSLSLVAGW